MTTGELVTYLTVFVSLVAAGMGFPIPEELPIVGAGVMAGKAPPDSQPEPQDVANLVAISPQAGYPAGISWYSAAAVFPEPSDTIPIRWWIILPVCIAGVVVSDVLLYTMGRYFGARLIQHRFMARLMPPEKRAQIEENFHRYGILVLLFARLLPGIRAPIFITAGTMRLPIRQFILADGIYAIPGVSLLFTLAFWFTNSFKELVEGAERRISNARPLLIVIAVMAIGIYFLLHFLRRPISTGEPPQLPPMPHLPHLPHLPLRGHGEPASPETSPAAVPPPTPSDTGPPLKPETGNHL